FAAGEVDPDVARGDALPLEVLLVEDRLDRDVLAAGDAAEARADHAPPLLVVVARRVAVDRGDHADGGVVERGALRIAVALAGVVLARDLAVHVDAHHERLAGRLRDRDRVVPRALPVDEAGTLPVLGGRRGPHLLTVDAGRRRAAEHL